ASQPSTVAETPAVNPPKRRHPKPPPVQARMVLAQLAVNPDENSMPAGTLGTAADLARTNLPPVSKASVPVPHLDGYQEIGFGTLAGFDFTLSKEIADVTSPSKQSDDPAEAQIPANVRQLNGKKVVIQGFLLPVKMDEGLAVEFLLMRNQSMCCYGVPPKINEWITVRMNGKGVQPKMDQPIAVAGTLRVGPARENGFLTGIYSIDGEKTFGSF
ncbi:MAG TPA: DUF3299 domain-containing protein, partial [Verrucomicrobiae bacterium]|nr:DUF3299 domain-containing protein [Verrucomicrobiae bacterium]